MIDLMGEASDVSEKWIPLSGPMLSIIARPCDAATMIDLMGEASDVSEKWIPLFGPML